MERQRYLFYFLSEGVNLCIGGRNFRYAHYVTTYLIFRRGRRAICTHFRRVFIKMFFFLITSKSFFLSAFISLVWNGYNVTHFSHFIGCILTWFGGDGDHLADFLPLKD